MSELVERLRNRINDSHMDNERLMDDAIDALEAKDALIAEMIKWLEYLPAPYPDDAEMVQSLISKVKSAT